MSVVKKIGTNLPTSTTKSTASTTTGSRSARLLAEMGVTDESAQAFYEQRTQMDAALKARQLITQAQAAKSALEDYKDTVASAYNRAAVRGTQLSDSDQQVLDMGLYQRQNALNGAENALKSAGIDPKTYEYDPRLNHQTEVDTYKAAKKAYEGYQDTVAKAYNSAAMRGTQLSDSDQQVLDMGLYQHQNDLKNAENALKNAGVNPDTVYDPSIFERIGKTLSGAAKSTAGQNINFFGTLADAEMQNAANVDKAKDYVKKAAGDGFWGDVLGSFAFSGTPQSYYDPTGISAIYAAADSITQRGQEDITRAKQGAGKAGQLLVDAGVSGTQMLGDAALNALAPGAGLMGLYTRAAGGAMQEARQAGADTGRQLLYGAAIGGVETLTERMFDGVAKIYGGGAADEVVDKLIGKLTTNAVGQWALRVLAGMGGEAVEEVVAGAIDPALKSIYDGERMGSHYSADTVTDILHDAAVGGLLGGLGTGVSVVTGQYTPPANWGNVVTDYATALRNDGNVSLADALTEAYDGTMSPGRYIDSMGDYYRSGRSGNGLNLTDAAKRGSLSEQQMLSAYEAGQFDRSLEALYNNAMQQAQAEVAQEAAQEPANRPTETVSDQTGIYTAETPETEIRGPRAVTADAATVETVPTVPAQTTGQASQASTDIPPTNRGGKGVTYTSNNSAVPYTWAVISADDLITSNDIDGQANPRYPAELQPRDRSRVASQEQIAKMSRTLNPALLEASPTAQNGAPIIRGDGVVIGGNARSAAIISAYSKGMAGEYESYLREKASEFGLKPENFPQKPVLVRVMDTDTDYIRLSQDLNVSTLSSYSSTEKAVQDAERMTPDIVSLLTPNETGSLNTVGNRDFISAFLNNVVSETERGALSTADGLLSQEGLKRAENAVFAFAYGDTKLIQRFSESLDNDAKNITNALIQAAASAVTYRANVENGSAYDMPVTDTILSALDIYNQARYNNHTVEEYAAQPTMFDRPSVEAVWLASFLEANKRSALQIRSMFTALYDSAIEAGDPRQESMLGGAEDVTLSTTVREAARKYSETTGRSVRPLSDFEGIGRYTQDSGGSQRAGTAQSLGYDGTGIQPGNRSDAEANGRGAQAEQRQIDKNPGVRYSRDAGDVGNKSEKSARIEPDLNDTQRYNLLRDRDLTVQPYNTEKLSEIVDNKNTRYRPISRDAKSPPQQDHSDEWETSRVSRSPGGKEHGLSKSPRSLSDIIEGIRHDFGINITTGHIRGSGVRGQYNTQNDGIRTRVTNDLPTISHELGHHFDEQYNLIGSMPSNVRDEIVNNLDPAFAAQYSDAELPGEGVAEFLRRYFQNWETASIDYPEFTKYFLNKLSGHDRALIQQFADEINAYYAIDTDSAASSIRLREEGPSDARTKVEKLKDTADALYQAWNDSLHGIKLFDKTTGANTYKLATNSAYADAVAGQILAGDLTDINGQYIGPGLKTALNGVDLSHKAKYRSALDGDDTRTYSEYQLFGEYLIVKHGPERLSEGMRIFADDRKNSTKWMQERAQELEKRFPKFQEASERLYTFEKNFLQTWGVETGLISAETAEQWAARWGYYVPLNRAVSIQGRGVGARRGFANQDSTIKRAKGSGLDIIHPVDNIINNMVKMVNAGIRNNVMRSITDAATAFGADATFLEMVPTPMKRTDVSLENTKAKLKSGVEGIGLETADEEKVFSVIEGVDDILSQYGRGKAYGDVITVLKEGKPEYWKINDPLLLESVTTMAPKTMDGILDTYAKVSRFMTGNITGNNIVWSVFSNAPRDLMTFFTYSKIRNPLKVFPAIAEAYIQKAKGDNADALYKEYLAMGGGKTSAYTADSNLARNTIRQFRGKTAGTYLNPMNWISWVGDTIETGPRYATYKLMREKMNMSPQDAFFESNDITVNFRRGGVKSREVNKVVPFFNAGVQGLDKFARWISADDAPKNIRSKVVRGRVCGWVAASAALAALCYGLNNSDDDKKHDYQMLSTYTKNSFWNIPLEDGKYFAIPKPREIAVLSSLIETALEYYEGGNKHAFDEFYNYAVTAALPSVASELAQLDFYGAIGSLGIVGTGAYLMANRDFMGRPIESAAMGNLEPKDRYTERTSKIAKAIGNAFNLSPQKIDFFLDSVLGGWSKYTRALFPVGGSSVVDWTLGVKNTYIKDNLYSNDLTNRLYSKAETSSQKHNSDSDDIEKAITAKRDSNMTTFYSRYYALAKNMPSAVSTTREARQTVLDMIDGYLKAADADYMTPEERAVYDICVSTGSTDYLPGVMQNRVKDNDDKEYKLTDYQYVDYQTDYLGLFYDNVVNSLGNAKNTSEKTALIRSAKKIAQERATERVLKRIGAEYTSKQLSDSISDSVMTEYYGLIDIANDDGALTQEEVVDIIDRMLNEELIGDDEAAILYSKKYKSNRNNPWARYDIIPSSITSSSMWNNASQRSQDYLAERLYDAEGDTKAAKKTRDKIKDAATVGIDEDMYWMWILALAEADLPTDSGNYGSWTNAELENAIRSISGLTDDQRDYLWHTQNSSDKNKPMW